MQRKAWLRFSALIGAALVAAPAAAQQADYDSATYQSLEQRIAELEALVSRQAGAAQPVSYSAGGGEAANTGCDSCGSGSCGGCEQPLPRVGQDFYGVGCRSCGVFGGAEVVFLKPFASNGDVPGNDVYNVLIDEPAQFGYEAAPRFWVGYLNDNGLGFQFRYWEFDHASQGTLLLGDTLNAGMEFRTIDVEALQRVDFRHWSFTFSGGLRYAESNLQEQFVDINPILPDSSFTFGNGFDGVGLTAGLQATRDLGYSGAFQWYTSLRGSVLFGKQHYNLDYQDIFFGFDIKATRDQATMGILEVNLGPQYRGDLSNGGQWFVRSGFEGQLWLGAGTADATPFDTTLGNIGFAGFSVALGIDR